MNYIKTESFTVPLSAILSLLTASFAYAAPLLPLGDGWEETFRLDVDGVMPQDGPVTGLAHLEKQVGMEYRRSQPFKLRGPDGELSLRTESWRAGFVFPFSSGNHLFLFQGGIGEHEMVGAVTGPNSSFNVTDQFDETRLKFAHQWGALRLRWGAEMRLIHIGTETKLEPDYEIGWGSEEGANFRLRIFRHESFGAIHWRIGEDSLQIVYPQRLEGGNLTLAFGKLFGPRVKAVFSDGQISRPSPVSGPYQLVRTGESRGASITVENFGTKRVGWRIGVRRFEYSGDGEFRTGDFLIGKMSSESNSVTGLDAELTGTLPNKVRWWSQAGYANRRGSGGGFIEELLPGVFGRAIENGRYWSASGHIEGIRLSEKLAIEQKTYSSALTLGFCNYGVHLGVKDRSQEDDPAMRQTKLRLNRLSAGWGTFRADVNIGRITLAGELSQAVLFAVKPADSSPVGTPATTLGGWIANVKIAFMF